MVKEIIKKIHITSILTELDILRKAQLTTIELLALNRAILKACLVRDQLPI